VTEHAMLRLGHEAQQALKETADNFPGSLGSVAGMVMKAACFPLGSFTRNYPLPRDELTREVSRLVTTPSEVRDMFQENLYMAPEGEQHQIAELVRALPVCVEADKITSAIRREKRQPTQAEDDVLAHADALRDALIQVDVYDHATSAEAEDGYVRPALAGTVDRLEAMERKTFSEATA